VRNNPLKYVDPTGMKLELVMRDIGNNKRMGWLASHSFLLITPDNPSDFGLESPFYFTLGGQKSSDGTLVGELNNQGDSNTFALGTENARETVLTPEGMTDTEFIESILENNHFYNQDPINYSAISVDGCNCHDYVAGINDASGGEFPDNIDPWTFDPGLGGSIPMKEGPRQKNAWKSEFQERVIQPIQERNKAWGRLRQSIGGAIQRYSSSADED